jgi:mRNA interferase MazF
MYFLDTWPLVGEADIDCPGVSAADERAKVADATACAVYSM